jgi:hypothetical protein
MTNSMKAIILILTVSICFQIHGQKKEKFKPGVTITEVKKDSSFKMPKSVLFVFEGDLHLINNFKDLSKYLRKEFKHYETAFNYDLSSNKPLPEDLKKIPDKTYDKELFESVCFIKISEFKSWDNHLIRERKQNYRSNLFLKDVKTNIQTLKLVLYINSFYTVSTQNKNISATIFAAMNSVD